MKTILIAVLLLCPVCLSEAYGQQGDGIKVFTKLLNSESEASKLSSGIAALSLRSPYNASTLTAIAQRLAVGDLRADEILIALDLCGEMAAALDLTDEGYLELTSRMAQMRKDRSEYVYIHLSVMERMNVPAFSLLAEAIGKTEQQTEFLARRRQLKGFGAYHALLQMFKLRYEGTALQVKKRRERTTAETP